MDLFHTEALQCPFGGTIDPMTYASLTFFRVSRTQNSAGEIITTWSTHVSLYGDLQPSTGKFPRFLHGDVEQIKSVFLVFGNPDVIVGDRCMVSAVQCEIEDIDNYGNAQAEIYLKWVR